MITALSTWSFWNFGIGEMFKYGFGQCYFFQCNDHIVLKYPLIGILGGKQKKVK